MDRTRARCSIEVGIDPETMLPDEIVMKVLIGRKSQDEKVIPESQAFSEGVEHIVFNYSYQIDSSEPVEEFVIPIGAKKYLK